MNDINILGGTVVDGTGAPRFTADVGVKDGVIVEVGKVTTAARRTLMADGALVTPGFTDIHTHYDGQASWDGDLAPSTEHGVTTLVLGNCGVGFAPCRPADQERLVQLMEGVEDIPGTALSEGLTWDWESFPGYLDALDRVPHAADLVAQVPHDALRVYVMGERAVAGSDATDDDLEAMQRVLREAFEAGAAGFSTGRTDTHRTATGEYTPASEASRRELVALAKVVGEQDHGVLQAVNDFDFMREDADFDREFGLLEAMVEVAPKRSMSISLLQRDQVAEQWSTIFGRLEGLAARGFDVRAQVAPRAIGVLLGLEATFHVFMGFPSYKDIAGLPLAERVAALRDPARKARMLKEQTTSVAGDGSRLPKLADELLAKLDLVALRTFRLGDPPNYEPRLEDSLFMEAQARGVSVLEVFYDAFLEDDGRSLLYFPLLNYTGMNLDTVRQMLTHPLALPGLSDGGAHVGTICDASFPTFLLTHWGRDRADGRLPLEALIKAQARDTARYMGLSDRGEILVGQRADINVIEFDRLGIRPPSMVADLPAGGKRLLQSARGYRATILGGSVVRLDDEPTGVKPGRVVRVSSSGPRYAGG
ncbi:MAG: amidohydrolase family protein [Myxococcota bacterium]